LGLSNIENIILNFLLPQWSSGKALASFSTNPGRPNPTKCCNLQTACP